MSRTKLPDGIYVLVEFLKTIQTGCDTASIAIRQGFPCPLSKTVIREWKEELFAYQELMKTWRVKNRISDHCVQSAATIAIMLERFEPLANEE